MFGLPFPSSVYFVNILPLDDPFRLAIFSIPILYFGYNSLIILRKVNSGATLVVHSNHITGLRFYSGRKVLTKKQKSRKYIVSYDGPFAAAIMGLLFFAAAEFLIVILFLRPVYTFG